jgi:hypothetical protein
LDDIFCEYHLGILSLKASLEQEGVFQILNCSCGEINCDGRYVEVKHIADDKVAWVMFYYQNKYPMKSLNGFLVKDNDYQEYVNINQRLDKIEKENRKDAQSKARDIIGSSKGVFIPLPLLFSRAQLEELVKE